MDPKDELLAKLKAIDADANAPAVEPELKPVSPPAPAPSVEATTQSSDELLAKLQAFDANANAPAAKPELKPVSPPTPAPSIEATPPISTDDFLAKLDALDQATRPTPLPIPTVAPTPQKPLQSSSTGSPAAPSRPTSPHLSSHSPSAKSSGRGKPHGNNNAPTHSTPASPTTQPYAGLPNVIERLKQFTQEQLAVHAAQNQAKAKRAQELSRAQAWLDALDPLSDDGFWFEQFSESYESRIQAALDFLDPGKAQGKQQ